MPEVEFFGEKLTVVTKPPKYALMVYARDVVSADLANADGETEARAQAAVIELAEASIHPTDRGKFVRLAKKHDAGMDELQPVVIAMMEAVADASERPTEQPSDSSDGPAVTEPKSVTSADDKLLAKFDGRPDKQAVILDLKDFLESQAS